MKYILVPVLYVVLYALMICWHIMEATCTLVANIFVFMWDFTLKPKNYFSFKKIRTPDPLDGHTISVNHYYRLTWMD